MRQIRAPKGGKVLVSTDGTNVTDAMKLIDEARMNGAKVLNGAATIERMLSDVIGVYFFGPMSAKRQEFEQVVLGSDWCSFAAKRKLVTHILDELEFDTAKDRAVLDRTLRDVMSYRNAFTHGGLCCEGVDVWLEYFEGKPRRQALTDEFLGKVEAVLLEAFVAIPKLAERVGADTAC